MTIKEIRQRNLLSLLAEAGGNQSEVARKANTTPSYIHDIISGAKTRYGKTRGVGDKLARELEKGFKKNQGWMDIDHSNTGINDNGGTYDSLGPLSQSEIELVKLSRKYEFTPERVEMIKSIIKAVAEGK